MMNYDKAGHENPVGTFASGTLDNYNPILTTDAKSNIFSSSYAMD